MTNRRPWFPFGMMVAIACDFAGCGEQDGTPASHVGPTSNGGTGRPITDPGVTPGSGATAVGETAARRPGRGGGAGGGRRAGAPGSGTVQNGVSATWTFPALVTDAERVDVPDVPGSSARAEDRPPVSTDFACVTVSNSGKDPATIHLEVDFAVYATPKSQDVTIGAQDPPSRPASRPASTSTRSTS